MEKSENYWGDLCKLHEVIFDLVMSDFIKNEKSHAIIL